MGSGLGDFDVEDGSPVRISCPNCRQFNRVRTVRTGEVETVEKTYLDADTGFKRTHRVTRPTRLGRELATAPEERSRLAATTGFLALVTLALYVVHAASAHAAQQDGGGSSFPLWPCLIGAAVVLALALSLILARAEALSRRDWYCRFCGVAYFQPGSQPPDAKAGHACSTAEFRRMVFTAGGCGDQA